MTEWTKEWPADPGYYWFYGWCFRDRTRRPEIHFVKVAHDANKKPIYVTDGHFLYRAEGAQGVWQPARIPKPPSLVMLPRMV